jgi:dipeptidyl aminopeptidase/acylaminoacyl peptidase
MTSACGQQVGKRIRLASSVLAVCLLFTSASALFSQAGSAEKRPLRQSDYDSWRSIQGQKLSPDGKYLAYALVPQEGDSEVVIRNLGTGQEWRHTRGTYSSFASSSSRNSAGAPVFTADSRFVVFRIPPGIAEVNRARRERKKADDMPKDVLAVIELATGALQTIERARSFQVPADGGDFIACLVEPDPARKQDRGNLVLLTVKNGSRRVLTGVENYMLTDDGELLFFTGARGDNAGIHVVRSGGGAPKAIVSGRGKYLKLTWSARHKRLAFLSDRGNSAARPGFSIYLWNQGNSAAMETISAATAGFPPDMLINERADLVFSGDGERLFFGVSDSPEEQQRSPRNGQNAVVDLWHWREDYIQPMQKVRAERDRNRHYRAVYHREDRRVVQLADLTMPEATPNSTGRWALGADDRPYRAAVDYDNSYFDFHLVDTTDGSRRLLLTKQHWRPAWSPRGDFLLYYDGKDWNTISIPDCRRVNLTRRLPVSFAKEDHDLPSPPPSYGYAGWTEKEDFVLIYDRFDIWQIAPDGSSSKNLTDGVGRENSLQFRHVKLDPGSVSIAANEPLLLRAENEETRDSGFYMDRLEGGLPEKLIMSARHFSTPIKAREADTYLLTASTFYDFPDLLVTTNTFRTMNKVSNANPQKANLLWGQAELVKFKDLDGLAGSAILIKPEDFDPRRKYPMLVYIYERLSEELHHFVDPKPGHSINPSFYASNGYLVLMPDIVYTIGEPGHSAFKCVLPAVQAVVDRGYVNEAALGIQGHSWGGYQVAYLVTRTSLFKAAAAGAPVANMTSAYSGIRWGTGLARQFQYEQTQSRIGGTLWQHPDRFIENSPVFLANHVQTPLLMLHNDGDDAVPWNQGIEYFLALRRLGKEAYLFNYNGESHSLRKRVNQKDYTLRLQQYFDHHLKGAERPEWMERGIPYLERELEKQRFNAQAARPPSSEASETPHQSRSSP